MASQLFRAGVVMVVRRDDGDLLVFERSDTPGSWQLPQGGIDVGEEPIDAAWRELHEETGLGRDEVRLVSELDDWIAYEWPPHIRAAAHDGEHRRGQIQRWFLFGVVPGLDVSPTPDQLEFSSWRWMDPHHLMHHVVEFRRTAYGRAFSRLLP